MHANHEGVTAGEHRGIHRKHYDKKFRSKIVKTGFERVGSLLMSFSANSIGARTLNRIGVTIAATIGSMAHTEEG